MFLLIKLSFSTRKNPFSRESIFQCIFQMKREWNKIFQLLKKHSYLLRKNGKNQEKCFFVIWQTFQKFYRSSRGCQDKKWFWEEEKSWSEIPIVFFTLYQWKKVTEYQEKCWHNWLHQWHPIFLNGMGGSRPQFLFWYLDTLEEYLCRSRCKVQCATDIIIHTWQCFMEQQRGLYFLFVG